MSFLYSLMTLITIGRLIKPWDGGSSTSRQAFQFVGWKAESDISQISLPFSPSTSSFTHTFFNC